MASKQRNLSTNLNAPNATNDLEVNRKCKNENEAFVRKSQHKKSRGKWNAKLVSLLGLRVIGRGDSANRLAERLRLVLHARQRRVCITTLISEQTTSSVILWNPIHRNGNSIKLLRMLTRWISSLKFELRS